MLFRLNQFGAEKLVDRTSTILSAEDMFSSILNELELLNKQISRKLTRFSLRELGKEKIAI